MPLLPRKNWSRTLLLLALLLVTVTGYLLWRSNLQRARLIEARQQINADLPAQRLAAAQVILRAQPDDAVIRMVEAEALVELQRYSAARQRLTPLTRISGPQGVQAMLLIADTHLDEAQALLEANAARLDDLTVERVEPMLAEAESIRRAFAENAEAAWHNYYLEARVRAIRATVADLQLKSVRFDLVKASYGQASEAISALGTRVAALTAQRANLDAQVQELCAKALTAYPHESAPLGLLCDLYLRRGDFDRLRASARQLAGVPTLPAPLAAHVARILLELDWSSARDVTDADIALARALLQHAQLTGRKTADYWLARADLALRQGAWDRAQAAAKRVLQEFDAHPQATCQLALAMAHLGRAPEAVQMLLAFRQMSPSAFVSYTLGQVYLLRGDAKQAREVFRQAIETDPQCLPARLALLSTLEADNAIASAEGEVITAYRQSPNHPQAIGYYARLLVDKADTGGIVQLLDEHYAQAFVPQAAQVHLAIDLALDSDVEVSRSSAALQAGQPADALAFVGQAWLKAPPLTRYQVAAIVNHWLLERLDADPLAQAELPGIPALALERPFVPGTIEPPRAAGAATPPADLDPLTLGRFVPTLLQRSLALATVAVDRWPQDAVLARDGLILGILTGTGFRHPRPMVPGPREPASFQADLDADLVLARGLWAEAIGSGSDAPALVNASVAAPTSEIAAPLADWIAVAAATPTELPGLVRAIMQKHPWNEAVALLALRRLVVADRSGEARALIASSIRPANPNLALLLHARLMLALGETTEALQTLSTFQVAAGGGLELRLQASEWKARVHLRDGGIEIVAGLFESLAIGAAEHRLDLQLAATDLWLAADRKPAAVGRLTALLADPKTPPRWLDLLLTRARVAMPPERQLGLIDELLRYRPDEPILLIHRAQILMQQGDLGAAGRLLAGVAKDHPDAPRLVLAQADLAQRQGQTDAAEAGYRRLGQLGHQAALVGSRRLLELEARRRSGR